MIHMMTAYTSEVDELDDALDEIFGQLDLDALKKNSVGIINCNIDFLDIGFAAAFRERLPIDIIGATTMASANRGGFDTYGLSLTILTSDDVKFETAASAALTAENYKKEIPAAYNIAASRLDGKPALIIGLFPYLESLSGAEALEALNEACSGAPIWGGLASDVNLSHDDCRTFRNNDEPQNASLVMLLLHGDVEPEFVVVSMPHENVRANRGMITESDGCVLKKVNDLPALEYLSSIGITIMENAPSVTPFMVYYSGSAEPVALGIFAVYPDGSLLCGGEMTEGALLTVGEVTAQTILSATEQGVKQILGSGKQNAALLYPCVTRYAMLTPDHNQEIKIIARELSSGVPPYAVAYAAGEVCPVRDKDGSWRNRFHNYSFSACAL